MTLFNNMRPDCGPAKTRNVVLSGSRQRGLTMVELLVAMVISLLIALAAIAALTVTRQGFNTVDAASQLRDNARFTADLIQRLGVQSGFEDVIYAGTPPTAAEIAANFPPNVSGFNSALSSSSDPLNSHTARTAGTDGYGSDILILRYQPVQLNPNSATADGSMIDCNGNSSTTAPASRNERMASILSVAVSTGEPSLMCATVNAAGTITAGQPIVRGVENFQVLYGVDGTALTPNTVFTGTQDTVPDKYLRADEIDIPGNAVGTNANWRRVRSLRIGVILRGPPNSAQSAVAQTLYPFGLAKASSTGAAGSALSSADDTGTEFHAPTDGRLRQVVTFTVHLRNAQ